MRFLKKIYYIWLDVQKYSFKIEIYFVSEID